MFDVIDRLKSEWTDRFVVISRPAPELARFANSTGVVRTVNMNGRCLVEFDQHNNVGWYDIDPAFLRIVPEPLPKPAAKAAPPAAGTTAVKASAKPAAQKPVSEKTVAKPAAKPAGGRPSTADILAMARGKKAGTDHAPASTIPAAADPSMQSSETAPVDVAAVSVPATPDQHSGGSPSPEKSATRRVTLSTTAEKIAWCRTHDGKG